MGKRGRRKGRRRSFFVDLLLDYSLSNVLVCVRDGPD